MLGELLKLFSSEIERMFGDELSLSMCPGASVASYVSRAVDDLDR
jgi:hypothetical protein